MQAPWNHILFIFVRTISIFPFHGILQNSKNDVPDPYRPSTCYSLDGHRTHFYHIVLKRISKITVPSTPFYGDNHISSVAEHFVAGTRHTVKNTVEWLIFVVIAIQSLLVLEKFPRLFLVFGNNDAGTCPTMVLNE